jgi:hypothetical protein
MPEMREIYFSEFADIQLAQHPISGGSQQYIQQLDAKTLFDAFLFSRITHFLDATYVSRFVPPCK